MSTRLEINFKRLLRRCETSASENTSHDWRFEKYVNSLQQYLTELRKHPGRPSNEVLVEYTKRVDFLKGYLESEKENEVKTAVTLVPFVFMPEVQKVSSLSSGDTRQLHLRARAKYEEKKRKELLDDSEFARKQLMQSDQLADNEHAKGDKDVNLDTIIKHHEKMQDKIAEEMLMLAANLKENARTANRIVKEDIKKLGDSTKQADHNVSKLEVESGRLEYHLRRACQWWLWIVVAIVCVVFIWTVLFIRVFPKQ